MIELGADQLVDHRLDARILAANLIGELAQRVKAHRLDPDLEIDQPLAEDRILGERAAAACDRFGEREQRD